jgi:FixJ family two-component response regulator
VVSTQPVIAVVDDESSVRTMLGRLLRLADYQVSAFSSGEDFLASLATSLPTCAILDIHMPGMSGLEVQARLRQAKVGIPVVFITASDDATLDDAVRGPDATQVLRKPFPVDDLLAAISVALAGRARGA